MFDALQNSDVYSKPRILSTKYSATSPSIFLKSKPDANTSIDENGLVKEIWNHDYFVPDTCVSEVTTLNVKSSYSDRAREAPIYRMLESAEERGRIVRFAKEPGVELRTAWRWWET
ncbi:hypothetical protein BD770DRAFT_447166 [Pilaira anomala]|nr:hypothetical protein BD770DRAFT_447166 [Pilaira anomala]